MVARDLCALLGLQPQLLGTQAQLQASRGSQQTLLLASTALVLVRQGFSSSSRYSYSSSRGCILPWLAKGVLNIRYRARLVLPVPVQGTQQVVSSLYNSACSRPTLRLS
jgi:hypothetical protein